MRMFKFDNRFTIPIIDGQKIGMIARDSDVCIGESIELTALLPYAGGVQYAPIKIVCIQNIQSIHVDCVLKKILINEQVQDTREIFFQCGWQSEDEAFEYYQNMYGKKFEGVFIAWQ